MSIQTELDHPLFDVLITRRRPRWEWRLRDTTGKIVMQGREKSRAEARYQSGRALFLLLLATGLRLAAPLIRADRAKPFNSRRVPARR